MPAVVAAQVALAAPAAEVVPAAEADLILRNGEIYIPGGWAHALAIKRGVIVAIGDEAAVKPYLAGKPQVIDLQGAAVLPGLHDMHVHPLGAGQTALGCNFP